MQVGTADAAEGYFDDGFVLFRRSQGDRINPQVSGGMGYYCGT